MIKEEKMDIKVGDRLEMKKPHPCKGNIFVVNRIGMDFKILCEKCGHEVMLPRMKVEKNIRRILPKED